MSFFSAVGDFLSDNAGDIISSGASIASGLMNRQASQDAARAVQRSGANATKLQRAIYQQNREDYAPYRAAGYGALDQQAALLGLGDQSQTEALRETPGYEFAFDEAMRGVDRGAAAQGQFLSGNRLKALQDRATGLADQTYGNQLNRYAGLAGTGQAATGATSQMGQNFGAQAGQNMQRSGNALASSYLTRANQGGRTLNNLAYIWG